MRKLAPNGGASNGVFWKYDSKRHDYEISIIDNDEWLVIGRQPVGPKHDPQMYARKWAGGDIGMGQQSMF